MNSVKDARFFVTASILLVAAISLVVTRKAKAHDHRLEILGGPITAKPANSQSTAMTSLVLVSNNGSEISQLLFIAMDMHGNPIVVNLLSQQRGISAYSVELYMIEFPNTLTQTISGYLIIEADQVEPAVEVLKLEPFVDGVKDALPGIGQLDTSRIIQWSFWVGFVFMLIISLAGIYFHYRHSKNKLKRIPSLRMAGLKWDFKENWASTFVAVGGFLSTLVGSDIMPKNSVLISKEGFQMLNILFPILIVTAPFLLTILNSIPKELKTDQGVVITDNEGKSPLLILPFAIGSTVVSWAVVGEILTQIVLFQELYVAGLLTLTVTQTTQLIMLIFALLGMFHVYKKIVQTASMAKTPDELKRLSTSSGIVKASLDNEIPERYAYLP